MLLSSALSSCEIQTHLSSLQHHNHKWLFLSLTHASHGFSPMFAWYLSSTSSLFFKVTVIFKIKCNVERNLETSNGPALTGRASIFDLKTFWAIYRCKQSSTVLLTHIHNSILKICPKVQGLNFHFSELDELLDEHGAKFVGSEIFSNPDYV